MALGAQGVQIRRASSNISYGMTAQGYNITTLAVMGTYAACNFIASGFTTATRFKIISSHSTAEGFEYMYTIKSVDTTIMEFHEHPATVLNGAGIYFACYTFNNIGEITGWSGPSETVAVADITNLQSTAKEKIAVGIPDGGQISVDFNFDLQSTAIAALIRKDMDSRVARYYDILFNDTVAGNTMPSYCAFRAKPTALSIQGAVDNIIKGSLTLDITYGVQYTTKR